VFKSSSIYLLTSIINRAIPFLLLPFLTKYLSPEEYGIVTIITIIISFSYPLMNMSGNLLIAKNYFVNKDQIKAINSNHFIIVILSFFVLLVTYTLLTQVFNVKFDVPYYWIVIVLFVGIFNSVNLNYITILRCSNRVYKYGQYEILKSVVNVGVSILLVVSFKMSWQGRAWGIIVSLVMYGLLSFYRQKKEDVLDFTFNKEVFKTNWKFVFPLIPLTLSNMVMNFSDRFFIKEIVGIKALGLYSVGYTLGMSILVYTESFSKAWQPWFFEKAKNFNENSRIIYKSVFYYFISLCVLPLVIFAGSKYVIYPYLINKQFAFSLNYVLGVAFAYSLQAIFIVLYSVLIWLDKTKIIGIASISTLVVNLLLNFWLVKYFAAMGAVYATIATYFLMVLILLIACIKYFRLRLSV
jgi:O-antigen/teichoic acid export membrane protein